MNRRNVLIGLGATAAGGGAILGSGAFSQVEANRSVNVQLAGDDSAILALNPVNTTVASISSGVLGLDFSGSGGGINYDAVTTWTDVFTITNNGDSSTTVHLSDSPNSATNLAIDSNNGEFYYDVGGDGTNDASDPKFEFHITSSSQSSVPTGTANVGSGNDVSIASGDTYYVGVRIDTTGADGNTVSAGNDLIQEVQLLAD